MNRGQRLEATETVSGERSGIQSNKMSMAKAPAPAETQCAVWLSPRDPCMCYARYLLLLFFFFKKSHGKQSPHFCALQRCLFFLPAICISASQPWHMEPAKMLSSTMLARGCSDSSFPPLPFRCRRGFIPQGIATCWHLSLRFCSHFQPEDFL